MALINCKDCGKLFSTDAKYCVHCGAYAQKLSGTKVFLYIAGFILLCAIFIPANNPSYTDNSSEQGYQEADPPVQKTTIFFSGDTSSNKNIIWPARPNMPSLQTAAFMTAKLESPDSMQPRIVGYTNLPDGTELSLQFNRLQAGLVYIENVIVSHGRFHSRKMLNALSDSKTPMPSGNYKLQILMPYLQTANVAKIIGKYGSNLKGGLVSKDYGVDYERVFRLGRNELPKLDEKIKEHNVNDILKETPGMREIFKQDDLTILAAINRISEAQQSCQRYLNIHDEISSAIFEDYLNFPAVYDATAKTFEVEAHFTLPKDRIPLAIICSMKLENYNWQLIKLSPVIEQ